MKISALILTKNEQDLIEDCLKQLNFVQEIIILDQNSRDQTVQIAKKFTKKIFTTNKEAFDQNRQILATYAQSPWLLYVDADERLNIQSVKEIREAIKTSKYSAYFFPRKNIILGKWLKHGGWWPDYVPRLFKKDKLIGWYGKVHESPEIQGRFGYLKEPIKHLTARNISQMFLKTANWAQVEAQLYYERENHGIHAVDEASSQTRQATFDVANRKRGKENHGRENVGIYYEAKHPEVSIAKVIKLTFVEFFRRFFLRKGFLDGQVGLIEAIYQALHQAIVLTYLWELQKGVGKKVPTNSK